MKWAHTERASHPRSKSRPDEVNARAVARVSVRYTTMHAHTPCQATSIRFILVLWSYDANIYSTTLDVEGTPRSYDGRRLPNSIQADNIECPEGKVVRCSCIRKYTHTQHHMVNCIMIENDTIILVCTCKTPFGPDRQIEKGQVIVTDRNVV